jgi:hypothetical protein
MNMIAAEGTVNEMSFSPALILVMMLLGRI